MLKEFNEWLLTWKPIHLCWWFEKHNKPIPKYLIGGGGSPPSVTTNAATSVSYTTATLNGDVTSDGGATITARGFVYSSSDSTPTIGEGGVTDTGNLGGTTGTYTHNATGLSAGTQYWYQAYATNSKGTTYGGVQTFTTLNNPPTVALNTPADTATGQSTTPTLEFTGTDSEGDSVRYNVQVDTVNTFDNSSGGGVIDSYSESNQSSSVFESSLVGQSFTGNGNTIDSVDLYLRDTNGRTGNIYAKIYSHTGTYGSTGKPNALLATSDPLDATNLSSSYALETLTFSGSNRITLTNGTNYFLVLDVESLAGYIEWGLDNTSPSHSGNRASYEASPSPTWTADPTRDCCFYVYAGGPLLNKVSGTDSGFANTVTPADTDPFNSGEKADYDVTDTLSNSTTYYWRVRGKDPTGSNTYGDWATTRSFTTEAGGGGGNTRRYTLTTLGIG